jgi:hypothetical protein
MKERITISLSKDGVLQVMLNEAGRDRMVRELQRLTSKNDHFHLDPDGMIDVQVSKRPYFEGDQVFEWGKVYLRTDESDALHFPHVLDEILESKSG